MKNIKIKKIDRLYEGQSLEEVKENINKSIEESTFCLLLIYDEHGSVINSFNDYEAIRSYAFNLRASKITKNGTRCRYCFTDYENGAEVSRFYFPDSPIVYEYYLKVI